MKRRLFTIVITTILILNLLNGVVCATSKNDYREIYLNFAKDADQNQENALNRYSDSFMLLDLNRDEVPELIGLITSFSRYDEAGNRLFANNEGYDDYAYIKKTYRLANAFSIIDGKVVEDSPWIQGTTIHAITMPFLPGDGVDETEEFCTTVRFRNREDFLTMNTVSGGKSNFTIIWYNEDGFSFSHAGYDEDFFDECEENAFPVAAISFYDDENKYLRTKSEAMETLLARYELEVSNLGDKTELSRISASSWAWADIDEEKELGIIPEEMYGQDLTQNITRAEFAAIAYKLTRILASYRYDWMTGSFDDIAGNVYENYIRGAASLGITRGTGEKEGLKLFSPDLHLTREQLATMLCRAIKAAKKLEEHIDIELNSSGAPVFADSYLVSDYARDSVNFLTGYGIIQGVDEYNVAPLDYATREQAILLALRIHNAYDVLTSPCNELKINEDVLENCEYTTVGELISGFEEDKCTLEELLSKLGVDNYQEGTYNGLGGLGSFCFEWNNYGIMISCPREKIAINASPYLEFEKGMISCFPQYVDPLVRADDPVLIRSLEVQSVNLTCTELSLNYPDGYSSLCATIFPVRISDVEYNWSSSDANVADIDLMAEDGKTDTVIVRAKNPGTAYITVQVRDENKTCSSECKVMVK